MSKVHQLMAILLASAAQFAFPAAAQAAGPCEDFVPTAPQERTQGRPITAEDLVRLRDIGYSHLAPQQRLLALSPDRRQVAFVMHRADAANNSYCQGLVITGVHPGDQARVLDTSDELIMVPVPIRGIRVAYGYPTPVVPKWSPDGNWIAYLKRTNGVTQAWRIRPDGSGRQMITHSDVDVEDVEWSASGDAIVFGSRASLRDAQASIEREGEQGFLFDDRIATYSSSRPAISGSLPYVRRAVDLETGRERDATQAELARLPVPGAADPAENMRTAIGANGRRAWTARADPARYLSPVALWANDESGHPVQCSYPMCAQGMSYDIPGLWWSEDGRDVVFLRREGWSNSEVAAYRWRPGGGEPRRIFSTQDVLLGCERAAASLLCAREGSTQPRRLVSIDLSNGASRPLFDPNPEFQNIRLGSARRLHWLNEYGVQSYGDLILPPTHQPGQRHPLIIVQYWTQGFLRGGIGDEYPIQLFARAGYAVLSVQAPPAFSSSSADHRSFEAAAADLNEHWSHRRNIVSSLMTGINLVINEGVVDPHRIGITGVSDGSTTVQYALAAHPSFFSAASIASCCLEPSAFLIYGGTGLADESRVRGFPPARGEAASEWGLQSTVLNADRIDVPILMQLADHEYLIGVDTFMALREHNRPVEMYIFPEEYHLKWQPRHRMAIYSRNLDWFDFWLRGMENDRPGRAEEYLRWRAMREAQCRRRSGTDAPWYCATTASLGGSASDTRH